jgi:hypothetical protein
LINTTNPSLTVGGQAVSHAGELTNGTESSPTSLSGALTGVVEVSVNIQGSGQAILRINGTRIAYENSVIFEEVTNGVLYGRYYGTFNPTTSMNYIVVTGLSYLISDVTYSSQILTIQVNGTSGTTSTTYVYLGNKGEPTTVTGASYTYNSGTKILTLTVTHSSSQEVVLYWLLGDLDGDGDVDRFDFEILAVAYGSTEGDPNYNPEADLDSDGDIDRFDFAILSLNYGWPN